MRKKNENEKIKRNIDEDEDDNIGIDENAEKNSKYAVITYLALLVSVILYTITNNIVFFALSGFLIFMFGAYDIIIRKMKISDFRVMFYASVVAILFFISHIQYNQFTALVIILTVGMMCVLTLLRLQGVGDILLVPLILAFPFLSIASLFMSGIIIVVLTLLNKDGKLIEIFKDNNYPLIFFFALSFILITIYYAFMGLQIYTNICDVYIINEENIGILKNCSKIIYEMPISKPYVP